MMLVSRVREVQVSDMYVHVRFRTRDRSIIMYQYMHVNSKNKANKE